MVEMSDSETVIGTMHCPACGLNTGIRATPGTWAFTCPGCREHVTAVTKRTSLEKTSELQTSRFWPESVIKGVK